MLRSRFLPVAIIFVVGACTTFLPPSSFLSRAAALSTGLAFGFVYSRLVSWRQPLRLGSCSLAHSHRAGSPTHLSSSTDLFFEPLTRFSHLLRLQGNMGNLVWHQYSRFVSITASVCKYPLNIQSRGWRLTFVPRCRVGRVLRPFLSEILLGLCWWYIAGPRRTPVSIGPLHSLSSMTLIAVH